MSSPKKSPRIYLSPPDVGNAEREALLEAFDSGWIAPVGPHLARFESALAKAAGTAHAVALSSGTAALHLALQELGVRAGDRVYCSTLTFVASVNAIRYCGAEPVLIDSETQSWCLDPNLLADQLKRDAARDSLPAAIEVVDIYGQCADWAAIQSICAEYEVSIVEDASEALGASHDLGKAGSFGRAAALSFNGNKMTTTSGGGALVTDDAALAERVRFLATQAREPVREYLHREVGYNYRMSNLLAALGIVQVARLEEFVERRRGIFSCYQQALGELPGVRFMPETPWGLGNRWLTCLTIEDPAPCRAGDLIDALESENIEARPVWRPMHLQPAYAECECVGGDVAQRLYETGLCLPSGSTLSSEDQQRVIQIIRKCFGEV